MSAAILAAIHRQDASDEAMRAWLSNSPLSWLPLDFWSKA